MNLFKGLTEFEKCGFWAAVSLFLLSLGLNDSRLSDVLLILSIVGLGYAYIRFRGVKK